MAEIKSALELALERTENVKADKESVVAYELKQTGQRLASQALSDPEFDLQKAWKSFGGKERDAVKEGFLQTLLANISLPSDEAALQRLDRIKQALAAVMKDKHQIQFIHQQLQKFLSQYLDDKKRLEDALQSQFARRLAQKEEELSRQVGTPVKLRPEQDPDFMNALRQNMGQLDQQYGEVLEQVKGDLGTIFRKSA